MGNKLTQDQLEVFTHSTNCKDHKLVKSKEIQKLYRHYHDLDKHKKGFVTIDDINKLPELERNPLRYYILQYVMKNQEQVDFQEFLKLIDIFKNNKLDEQQKCNAFNPVVFNLLDFNKDGKICHEDLLVNMKLLLSNNIEEYQLNEIVEETINEYASDGKGLSYEDFLNIID